MVGGICGSNASSTTSGRIENCYNIGTINTIINDNDDKRNIAVIENEKAVVNNCYYLEDNYIAEEDGASGRDADDLPAAKLLIAYKLVRTILYGDRHLQTKAEIHTRYLVGKPFIRM